MGDVGENVDPWEGKPRWYVHDPAARADILRAADHARENSGHVQVVHFHRQGDACTGECGPRHPIFGGVP